MISDDKKKLLLAATNLWYETCKGILGDETKEEMIPLLANHCVEVAKREDLCPHCVAMATLDIAMQAGTLKVPDIEIVTIDKTATTH